MQEKKTQAISLIKSSYYFVPEGESAIENVARDTQNKCLKLFRDIQHLSEPQKSAQRSAGITAIEQNTKTRAIMEIPDSSGYNFSAISFKVSFDDKTTEHELEEGLRSVTYLFKINNNGNLEIDAQEFVRHSNEYEPTPLSTTHCLAVCKRFQLPESLIQTISSTSSPINAGVKPTVTQSPVAQNLEPSASANRY